MFTSSVFMLHQWPVLYILFLLFIAVISYRPCSNGWSSSIFRIISIFEKLECKFITNSFGARHFGQLFFILLLIAFDNQHFFVT